MFAKRSFGLRILFAIITLACICMLGFSETVVGVKVPDYQEGIPFPEYPILVREVGESCDEVFPAKLVKLNEGMAFIRVARWRSIAIDGQRHHVFIIKEIALAGRIVWPDWKHDHPLPPEVQLRLDEMNAKDGI